MAPSLATRKHSRPGRTDKRASAVCFCCGFVPVRQNNKEKTLFRRSVWVSDVVDVYDRKKRERREIARAHREMHKMPPRESRGSSKSRASLLFGEEEEEEEKHLRCAHALVASNEKTGKTSSPPNCSRSTLSTRASRTQTTLMTSFPRGRHVLLLLYLQSFRHQSSSLKRRRRRRPGRRPRNTKPPQKHRRTRLLLKRICAREPREPTKTHKAPSGFLLRSVTKRERENALLKKFFGELFYI